MQLLSIRAKTRIQFLALMIQCCFQTIPPPHGVNRCNREPQLLMEKCYPSDVLARVEKMLRKNHIVGSETVICVN